jgi:hypothetical protein
VLGVAVGFLGAGDTFTIGLVGSVAVFAGVVTDLGVNTFRSADGDALGAVLAAGVSFFGVGRENLVGLAKNGDDDRLVDDLAGDNGPIDLLWWVLEGCVEGGVCFGVGGDFGVRVNSAGRFGVDAILGEGAKAFAGGVL